VRSGRGGAEVWVRLDWSFDGGRLADPAPVGMMEVRRRHRFRERPARTQRHGCLHLSRADLELTWGAAPRCRGVGRRVSRFLDHSSLAEFLTITAQLTALLKAEEAQASSVRRWDSSDEGLKPRDEKGPRRRTSHRLTRNMHRHAHSRIRSWPCPSHFISACGCSAGEPTTKSWGRCSIPPGPSVVRPDACTLQCEQVMKGSKAR
jgi:hypothetical protein